MADQQRERCARLLRGLLDQQLSGELEIVLLDFGHGQHPKIAGADHHRVRCIPFERGIGFGEALAQGVGLSRAPVVAFIEEHTVVDPGWAQALCKAHEDEWAAVGPEVLCENPGRGATRLVELISHGPWSPPASRSETSQLRWQNVSYKTGVLKKYSSCLPLLLNAEGTLFERLRSDGYRLLIEPAARLRHSNESSFRAFLWGSYLSNRLSAGSRAKIYGMNWFQRSLRACNAFLTPFRSTFRLFRTLSAEGDRNRVVQFWMFLPGVLLYYMVLAIAVQAGYLFGAGNAAIRFLDYELNQFRGIGEAGERRIGIGKGLLER